MVFGKRINSVNYSCQNFFAVAIISNNLIIELSGCQIKITKRKMI